MKPRQLLAALVLSVAALLLASVPVYAAIPQPTTLTINSVYAYRHCLESDDQLYIAQYSCSCNANYNINEAFLARLMDGATELKALAPYAYFNSGYGEGVFALYFTADEIAAKGMVWNGAYTMKFEGNPTLSWAGGTPSSISLSAFDSWSSSTNIAETHSEIAARVLYLADYLEQQWGINLVDTVSMGTYLSTYGTDYFASTIPNLQNMAPSIFTGSTAEPDWPQKTYAQAYGVNLAASAAGTPLDISAAAAALGISTMWLSSVCWILGGVLVLFYALRPMGSTRPLVLLCIPLLTVGALLSMIPLVFVVMLALGAWVFSLWVLIYTPSSA